MAVRGDGTAADLPTEVIRTAWGSLEYRWEPRDGPVIVVLHGGHMRAGLSLGEKVYRAAGYSLLVPSRPGYGATDLSVGAAPEGSADAVTVLCGLLGIDQVDEACDGVSAGARPPWPWLPGIPTWSCTGAGIRCLTVLLAGSGSGNAKARTCRVLAPVRRRGLAADPVVARTAPGGSAVHAVRGVDHGAPPGCPRPAVRGAPGRSDRAVVVDAFRPRIRERLGSARWGTAVLGGARRAALVIASRREGSVPYGHAVELARALPRAELVDSEAAGHFVWFGPDRNRIEQLITAFLAQSATACWRVRRAGMTEQVRPGLASYCSRQRSISAAISRCMKP